MDVRHQQMDVHVLTFGHEVIPQGPKPGTRVDDNRFTTIEAYLNAARVPAVNNGFSSRRRDGTPCSPESDFHVLISARNVVREFLTYLFALRVSIQKNR
ncbi:conserved hypothetical protein [delta proteobacterium NaphS2]|nr:conserved hypothetical protein [delta proteobacterium NaphS2]